MCFTAQHSCKNQFQITSSLKRVLLFFFGWKVMQWQAGMNETCRTYENVTSHICIVMWHTCMSLHVTHMNAPCHVTHLNASRHTYSNARHILALFSSFHSSSPSPHSPALSPSLDRHNAAVTCSNLIFNLSYSLLLCRSLSRHSLF